MSKEKQIEGMARDQINGMVKVLEASCDESATCICNCDLCKATALYNAGCRMQSEGRVKVGDKVYQTDGVRIYECTVRKIIYETYCIDFDESAIGKTVFLSLDEVKKELNNDTMRHL